MYLCKPGTGSGSEGLTQIKTFLLSCFYGEEIHTFIVSVIAEEQGHHPTMTIIYNKLKVTLTTHASGGLTDNDFIMAKIIDSLENCQMN